MSFGCGGQTGGIRFGGPAAGAGRKTPRASSRAPKTGGAVLSEALEARQLFALSVSATTPDSTGAAALAATLLGSNTGITISSATLAAAVNQSGTYSGFDITSGSNHISMVDGILLTTGNVASAAPPRHSQSTTLGLPGDADLGGLFPDPAFDANILTLTFTAPASTRSITFDLVYGTGEGVGDLDGFGAFLDGTSITFDAAQRPYGKSETMNYINYPADVAGLTGGTYSEGYLTLTKALRTTAPLDPNVTTHTLKLVIADTYDDLVDSGAFLARLRGVESTTNAANTVALAASAGTLAFSQSSTSVNNAAGTATLTVNRTAGSDGVVTVDYATADGTAFAGTQYTAASGTLTFADGQTSKTIVVPIADLPDAASSGAFTLNLSNATGGASIGGLSSQSVTIDNSRSVVSLSSPTYVTTSTQNAASVTVSRVGNTTVGAAIDYATADGTAHAGQQYTATSGTLSFAPGEASKTVSIPVNAGPSSPPSENFTFTLTNPGAATLAGTTTSATVSITNALSAVELDATPINIVAGAGPAVFTVTRAGNLSGSATVAYATADGSATAGLNYTSTSGTLTFTSGQSSRTVSVPTLSAPSAPANSDFTLTLTNPTGGAVVGGHSAQTATLVNTQSSGAFASATVAAVADASSVELTVVRTGNTTGAATFGYATADGTAIAGQAYVASSGAVEFASGETSKTIVIPLIVDPTNPASTTFTVTLAAVPNDPNAVGGIVTASVEVRNDRSLVAFAAPTFAPLGETDSSVLITVQRQGDLSAAAAVDFATFDATALAGADYTAASGTLTFAAEQSTATFTITLPTRPASSPAVGFGVVLQAPAGNATLDGPDALGTASIELPARDAAASSGLRFNTHRTSGQNPSPADTRQAQRIYNVEVAFDNTFSGNPDLQSLRLYRRSKEQANGVATNRQVAIANVAYDSTHRTLNVTPGKGLAQNQFYQITAQFPAVTSTPAVAAPPSGHVGPTFSVWFARGKRLTYIDSAGNRVQLRLKGNGVMQLIRDADGDGGTLVFQDTDSHSVLSGKVMRSPYHPAPGGTTPLAHIVGLNGAQNLLPDSIEVGDVSN